MLLSASRSGSAAMQEFWLKEKLCFITENRRWRWEIKMSRKSYDRIEEVLKVAKRPLAPHEFEKIPMLSEERQDRLVNGRQFVNYSEATLGRRLREMVTLGRAESRTRAGKNFKEFLLKAVPALLLAAFVGCAAAPVKAPEPPATIWGAALDTIKSGDKCFAMQEGFENGGAVRWRAQSVPCPELQKPIPPATTAEIKAYLKDLEKAKSAIKLIDELGATSRPLKKINKPSKSGAH